MELKRIQCSVCGSPLNEPNNGFYVCPCCRSTFQEEKTTLEQEAILNVLSYDKMEKLANARSNLYKVTHETYLSNDRIKNAVNQVKSLYPEDVLANFYDAFLVNKNEVTEFLLSFDLEENKSYLQTIVEFTIQNLDFAFVVALKDLVDRAYQGQEKYDYNTRIEAEAEKLNQGVYNLDIDRDVFVCYSSKDMKEVVEITNYLESSELSCFVALRNLRHGIGSLENYQESIFKAMRHCKCVVFLSSTNSRKLSCDALKIELPYLKDHLKDTKRVEYIVEDYQSMGENPIAKRLIQQTFAGLEWSKTLDDLIDRLSSIVFAISDEQKKPIEQANHKMEEVKYCINCLSKNPINMKFCGNCGEKEFRDTLEEAAAAFKEKTTKAVTPKPKKFKYCVACLSKNALDMKFCGNCGGKEFRDSLAEATAYQKGIEDAKKAKEKAEVERLANEEKAKKAKATVATPSSLNKPQGKFVEFGTFNGKPIQWMVLKNDGQKVLLLTRYVLVERPFDSTSNNYANSSIRIWLNGDFYNSSFKLEEKRRIMIATVRNGERSTNPRNDPRYWNNGKNPNYCPDTKDKLFLLSEDEVTNPEYGFDSSVKPSGTRIAKNLKGQTPWWWLRSPNYRNVHYISNVHCDGDAHYANHASGNGGVRPAMWVKL